MLIDLVRKRPSPLQPVTIRGTSIEIVEKYKYLGTIIDYKLTWSANTLARYSEAQQRLYFLRKLYSFNAETTTLTLFYITFIQSHPVLGRGSFCPEQEHARQGKLWDLMLKASPILQISEPSI